MKLYYSPGACSLSPHICLREAGLTFDLEQVDLGTKKTASGADYTAVNANGYVPALTLDGGDTLTEGPAIVQWIADQKPDSGLMPKNGTMDRYRAQSWLNFITSELHKGIGALFNPKVPDAWRTMTIERLGGRLTVEAGPGGRSRLELPAALMPSPPPDPPPPAVPAQPPQPAAVP